MEPTKGASTLIVGALVVDTATLGFLLATGWGGTAVREWYRQLRIGAYAMDVLSLVVGTGLAFLVVGEHADLWKKVALSVLVQLVHDVVFGSLLFQPNFGSHSLVMQLFRNYAEEMTWNVLWADAVMMILTVLVAELLQNRSRNHVLIGAIAAYVGMLLVYSV